MWNRWIYQKGMIWISVDKKAWFLIFCGNIRGHRLHRKIVLGVDTHNLKFAWFHHKFLTYRLHLKKKKEKKERPKDNSTIPTIWNGKSLLGPRFSKVRFIMHSDGLQLMSSIVTPVCRMVTKHRSGPVVYVTFQLAEIEWE